MTEKRAKEIDEMLLASLIDRPRYLDMGRSPVEAIERCFALADTGMVRIDDDGWVHLNEPQQGISNRNA